MTKPIKKLRIGRFTASIFRNEERLSVQIEKSWKDKKTDEWKNAGFTIFPREVPDAISLLLAVNRNVRRVKTVEPTTEAGEETKTSGGEGPWLD